MRGTRIHHARPSDFCWLNSINGNKRSCQLRLRRGLSRFISIEGKGRSTTFNAAAGDRMCGRFCAVFKYTLRVVPVYLRIAVQGNQRGTETANLFESSSIFFSPSDLSSRDTLARWIGGIVWQIPNLEEGVEEFRDETIATFMESPAILRSSDCTVEWPSKRSYFVCRIGRRS